jgi:hypothetical protein
MRGKQAIRRDQRAQLSKPSKHAPVLDSRRSRIGWCGGNDIGVICAAFESRSGEQRSSYLAAVALRLCKAALKRNTVSPTKVRAGLLCDQTDFSRLQSRFGDCSQDEHSSCLTEGRLTEILGRLRFVVPLLRRERYHLLCLRYRLQQCFKSRVLRFIA